jgi:erythromycin esterase-like protein
MRCSPVGRRHSNPKVVVWEHNFHIGDARATQMSEHGELNVGQLVRERYGRRAALIGFSTYTETVTAASEWGGPAERKVIRPALAESYEALLHETGRSNFLVSWQHGGFLAAALSEPHLERAIGVIYLPVTERLSHYFPARLFEQFDAIVHCDHTSSVQPLDAPTERPAEEAETIPSGM